VVLQAVAAVAAMNTVEGHLLMIMVVLTPSIATHQ